MRPLCAFDLDHTLVRSTLDLGAVKAEVHGFVREAGVRLPPGAGTWTIGQLIARAAEDDTDLAARCWGICEAHEQRAAGDAASEPGAREALEALQASGFPLAVWTNNTRGVAEVVLARCDLRGFFTVLVTRDEAPLKPDPAGLRLLEAAFPERRVLVVGDSWVDGAAAQAGGALFVAYGTDPADLARRGVAAQLRVGDLRALPDALLRL